MAKDYSRQLAQVKKAIRDKGREIKLIKFDDTPTDANKPWGQSNNSRDRARYSVSVFALNVPLMGNDLGFNKKKLDLISDSELEFLVEPGEDDPENLNDYNVLEDDGIQYKITAVDRLKPATLTLMYAIGASR